MKTHHTGNTTMTKLAIATLMTVTLASSVVTFGAAATSPKKPQVAQMISLDTFHPDSYENTEQTKMYPAPDSGMKQVVLTLPKRVDEQDYKLEIEIGQWQQQDCNKQRLGGEIQQQTVQGWGYSYYQVDRISAGPSTLMACPDTATTREFVTLMNSLTLDYDSRLPKVFYIPESAQLRYKVWQSNNQHQYSN
ncbi:serine protease inhibitor ecotin [Shewanella sp. Scap07]|uniref:serine protease inhibitor ecotin n=1 Tax=Shewanella sp. Scap07 TaxID=2589987 RepID=UPI002118726E|nr:serine protease inhibitor ecotin [Shewanella sp. Scap07]